MFLIFKTSKVLQKHQILDIFSSFPRENGKESWRYIYIYIMRNYLLQLQKVLKFLQDIIFINFLNKIESTIKYGLEFNWKLWNLADRYKNLLKNQDYIYIVGGHCLGLPKILKNHWSEIQLYLFIKITFTSLNSTKTRRAKLLTWFFK
jgi:hypothetical protein